MSLTLPDGVDWVLDLLGYDWPNADEDKLFECAAAWRNFADQVNQASSQGSSAANEVLSANSGEAVDGFSQEWGSFSGGGDSGDNYLRDAAAAAEVIALAFDAAALAVIEGKVAVIVQLVMLAAELIAAQAAAPFTLGLSELGAAGATQATRLIVRQILDKIKREVMQAATKAMEHATMDAIKKMAKKAVSKESRKLATDYIKNTVKEEVKDKVVTAAKDSAKEFVQETVVQGAKDKAKEAATGMAQNVAEQGIESHFGERDGIRWGETADVGKEKAGEYIEDVKKDATDRVQEYKDGVTSLADPTTYIEHGKNDLETKRDELTDRGLDHAQRRVDHHTGGAATRHQETTDAAKDHVRSVFG
ncbi:WXG100-like domain-containing protein [Streptomyces pinistramenti]|uniref:WXG100-like domain-containing protein n=1 Tax=Streptomyces pinistramenti TaxID=2884812 RepID=UPI001D07F694|nr:PE-PGRS family protein [Streptomyces pinistramenti]MCB5909308.1 PE-PGRS family protein [Streptomyces pinistramenti]